MLHYAQMPQKTHTGGKADESFGWFWRWYERHYVLNLTITSFLFALQLVHLYWLTADVVAFRLLGESFFHPSPFWRTVIIIVDYTEIPGLISTSVLYIYELRKRYSIKYVGFLLALNSQWLHLFWITDEFVVDRFSETASGAVVLPIWLAWVAILIDYLELPVIVDTLVKVKKAFSARDRVGALKEALAE
jgi:hypothetical protein